MTNVNFFSRTVLYPFFTMEYSACLDSRLEFPKWFGPRATFPLGYSIHFRTFSSQTGFYPGYGVEGSFLKVSLLIWAAKVSLRQAVLDPENLYSGDGSYRVTPYGNKSYGTEPQGVIVSLSPIKVQFWSQNSSFYAPSMETVLTIKAKR